LEAALRQEPALLFNFKKHTGLYAYRRDFLLEFTAGRNQNARVKSHLNNFAPSIAALKSKLWKLRRHQSA
jgi:hypothetical protein